MQAVLVSFQNNAVDELAASSGRILAINKASNAVAFSVKGKPQEKQNDISDLCHKLARFPRFRNDPKRSQTSRRSIPRRRSVSRHRETGNPDWCWYHNQHGKSSKNCKKPDNYPNPKSTDTKKQFGKLPSRHTLTETVASEHNRLLYVTDVIIDTGAKVSFLPANSNDRFHGSVLNLQAANGKPIATYGKKYVCPNVGLRKAIHWIFMVQKFLPTIGIDLLHTNTRNQRLVEGNAKLSVSVTSFSECKLFPITIRHTTDPFCHPLLDRYSGIYQPQPTLPCVTSNVTQHITTTGPSVFSKARRLASEKLRLAKNEFDHMIELGIIRLSNSPWASPLRIVPKKDSIDWRLTGDYRRLNERTIPDRCLLPHIHGLTATLKAITVFSKIDLVKAYNEIPMATDDIPKTATITPFRLYEFL
ncbi:hypothetical protein Smp_190590 [Schistosoma mansoni]|uniref:hypothetical protein n=1 Tax=Schistosoma mansoni TaxID=6183 RepID=UPI00022DC846|nr:hypothetical protein Smp_190590 [Schistosoma mansoni]|eukprot:XP_018652683.1 hypothetical protein Smp_190590 [Schistosoma mansoni]